MQYTRDFLGEPKRSAVGGEEQFQNVPALWQARATFLRWMPGDALGAREPERVR